MCAVTTGPNVKRRQTTSPTHPTVAPSVAHSQAASRPLAPKRWITSPLHPSCGHRTDTWHRHTGVILSPTREKQKETACPVCFLMFCHFCINPSERIQVDSFQGGKAPTQRGIQTKGMVQRLCHTLPSICSLSQPSWPHLHGQFLPSKEASLSQENLLFSTIHPVDRLALETVSSNEQKEQQEFSTRRGFVSYQWPVAIQDDKI